MGFQPRRRWVAIAVLVTISTVASMGAAGVFGFFICEGCRPTYTRPDPLPKELVRPEKVEEPPANPK